MLAVIPEPGNANWSRSRAFASQCFGRRHSNSFQLVRSGSANSKLIHLAANAWILLNT